MMRKSFVMPGLLVRPHTSIQGGVWYDRKELEPEGEAPPEGTIRAWSTEKTVRDVSEHERATSIRSKCQALFRPGGGKPVAYSTKFGLLCPQDRESELETAIQVAEGLAADFNESARFSRIVVDVCVAVIRDDDERTMRGITSEIRGFLEEMEAGVRDLDPAAIRAARDRAKELGGILSQGQRDKVDAAREAATVAAREITRRVVKKGEAAEGVLQELNLSAISRARFSFLDVDECEQGELEAIVPTVAPRAMDFGSEPEPEAMAAAPMGGGRTSGIWIIEEGNQNGV